MFKMSAFGVETGQQMTPPLVDGVAHNRDVHGNGKTNMPKMGMGMGRVHVTMGMGMATFSCVPKFPSDDSMRMQANEIL